MRVSVKLGLIAAATFAAAGLILAVLVSGGSPTPSGAPPAGAAVPAHDSAHQKPVSIRTLAVYTNAEPAPSAQPERMRALLIKGELPAVALEATVVTDADCAPDADGVSHCRNRLKLPSGKTITVRHPHRWPTSRA
jgi:hypothetical protein